MLPGGPPEIFRARQLAATPVGRHGRRHPQADRDQGDGGDHARGLRVDDASVQQHYGRLSESEVRVEGHGRGAGVAGSGQLRPVVPVGLPADSADLADLCQY